MFAVRFRTFHFGSMLATALSVLLLPTMARAYTPEQQQACSGDAFRLCGADIPDVDRVTVCMIRNKSQLSPECRVYFRPSEPEEMPAVTRVTTRKPLSIKPAAKPQKSKKPKKPASAN
jgi:hypothetical protein